MDIVTIDQILNEKFLRELRALWAPTTTIMQLVVVRERIIERVCKAAEAPYREGNWETERLLLTSLTHTQKGKCLYEVCHGAFAFFGVPGVAWFYGMSEFSQDRFDYEYRTSGLLFCHRASNFTSGVNLEPLAPDHLAYRFSLRESTQFRHGTDWPTVMPMVLHRRQMDGGGYEGISAARWGEMRATFIRWGLLPKE